MKNPNRRADERRAAAGLESRADTLVIVNSRHESALKYAQWISDELDTDLISYSKKYLGYASLYRNVIYIGWVKAGEIMGLNILQQNYQNFHMAGKHIIVAAVGVGDLTETYYKSLYKGNYLKNFGDSFYILPGRVDPDTLKPGDKANLSTFMKNIHKEYAPEDATLIADRIIKGYNGVDRSKIDPIVQEILAIRNPKADDAEEMEEDGEE